MGMLLLFKNDKMTFLPFNFLTANDERSKSRTKFT